jgi:phospholipid/cholesterol/gamma-HCH transport system ATP-binding protein
MAYDETHSIVELRNLTFGYGERVVLTDVSLRVPQGKVTALVGPMGAGKTTTLRLVGGQLQAQSGQVLFEGQDVAAMDHDTLYAMRRRMGMMFQFGALFADISVLDNVAFPLREHTSLPEALIRDIVLMKLHAVGLRGARDLMPSDLSGGMTRRVALARAIALDPDLVVYDEPFSGLDPISLHTVAQLIRQLNDSLGLSSLFVSHEIEQTFEIADHIIVLADGKVVAQGTPEQMRSSTDAMVHQYVNSLPDGPVGFHYPRVPIAEDLGLAPSSGRGS